MTAWQARGLRPRRDKSAFTLTRNFPRQRSRSTGLLVAADDGSKITDRMQMLTSIDCILHLQDTFPCQHLSGEIAKFPAQLVIREWLLEIAAMTAHRMRVPAAVLERKCHLCWLVGR